MPLNHVCRAECRGVVHVQGVIADIDQSDEAFRLEVAGVLGSDWELVGVHQDADGPRTIGGRPVLVSFRRSAL